MNPIAVARFKCLTVVLTSTLSVTPAVSPETQEEINADDEFVIEEIVVTDLESSGQPTLEKYMASEPYTVDARRGRCG